MPLAPRGSSFVLGPEVLRDFERASTLEWLLGDGQGGYTSSTVIGLNTRRYHGLLTVAQQPPLGRMLLLSKLEETLVIGQERYELATNAYQGAVHPRGFEHASFFLFDPLPVFAWELPEGRLTRTIARAYGEPGIAVLYRYEGEPASLEVRPLLAYRDHHSLRREDRSWSAAAMVEGDDVTLHPCEACTPLCLRAPGGLWQTDRYWFHHFVYERERERGYDCVEDLFCPGVLRLSFDLDGNASLLAWAGPIGPARDPSEVAARERKRLRELGSDVEGCVGLLKRSVDHFVVPHGVAGRSVMIGYPWLPEGGRDTWLAVQGLCLTTNRHRDARAILSEGARRLQSGFLPAPLGEWDKQPKAWSLDAALFMILAAHRLNEATGDFNFVRSRLRESINAIIEGYRLGLRAGIGAGTDGLLRYECREPSLYHRGTCLEGLVRHVEVQAVWYNALLIAAHMASQWGDAVRAMQWNALAARVRDSFLRTFWDEELGYLADCVAVDGARDMSLRPYQLYALGLPHALLPREPSLRILAAIEHALLTPCGLRTLAPKDPRYRGRCVGSPAEREEAAQNGAAWPSLAGVYFDAQIRLHGEQGKRSAREWLRAFCDRVEETGLGQVCEYFDGDTPQRPQGVVAHALGTAELLRLSSRLAGKPPVLSGRERHT